MKEMIYSANRIKEVLHSGEYKGYKFCIMNLGTHPTAYVECKLENCNSYGDKRLDEISVHGGFTYLDNAYWDETDKTTYLGWDYAHFMDYAGYKLNFLDRMRSKENKKWTTAEIFEEVKHVIDQMSVITRMKEYNKLVRDKIPEIIEKSGAKAITRTLTDEEYKEYLVKKLFEEIAEFQESKSLEELGDIQEVLIALRIAYGYSAEKLFSNMFIKAQERGAFTQKILLIGVEEGASDEL